MRKNTRLTLIFYFVISALLVVSCGGKKNGSHVFTAIQFDKGVSFGNSKYAINTLSDSDFAGLVNSPALILKTLRKTGEAASEENLLAAREQFEISRNENTNVYFLKFYADDKTSALRFIDTFLVELSNEIGEKQGRSVKQQEAVIDSSMQKVRHCLDSLQEIITEMKSSGKSVGQNYLESLLVNGADSVLKKYLNKVPHTERERIKTERAYSVEERLLSFLIEKKTEISISSAGARACLSIVEKPFYVQK